MDLIAGSLVDLFYTSFNSVPNQHECSKLLRTSTVGESRSGEESRSGAGRLAQSKPFHIAQIC